METKKAITPSWYVYVWRERERTEEREDDEVSERKEEGLRSL